MYQTKYYTHTILYMYMSPVLPSFPSLAVQKSRRGPVIFAHVSDVRIERIVERVFLCVGAVQLRTSKRAKLPGNFPNVSS